MARLPDLQLFAAEHGLKIGTIASLIEYRSRVESLLEKVGEREHRTPRLANSRPTPSATSRAAVCIWPWCAANGVPTTAWPVRVHEPLSVLDALEVNRSMHSWSLDACLAHMAQKDQGVVVLLNCGESAEQLLAQFDGTARASHGPERGRMDLRTYGIGAQILRDCGVHKMALMGNPRRMPSMAGYGLEITGYITHISPEIGAGTHHVWRRQGKTGVLRQAACRARSCASAWCRRVSTKPSPTLWREACEAELLALGVSPENMVRVQVPGALEVPVALQALAESAQYDALIALGCIIRGETYHFELVANESGAGVSRVALDYQIPIANAILTTENLEQAIARQSDKGRDAARVAVEMANLMEDIG